MPISNIALLICYVVQKDTNIIGTFAVVGRENI
jgi:hypothetical protein